MSRQEDVGGPPGDQEFGGRMRAYSHKSVTRTESAGVAWSSVLRAWDQEIDPDSPPDAVARVTTEVRSAWHAAAGVVAEAYGMSVARRNNVLACSPYWMFSWWKGGRPWACQMPGVCPWCWGSRVVDLWERLTQILYLPEESVPASPASRYDVISLISTQGAWGDVEDFRSSLAIRCGGADIGNSFGVVPRSRDLRRINPVGFIELCTPQLTGRHCGLRLRQLIVKPAGAAIPAFPFPAGYVQLTCLHKPTRSLLASTFSDVFRYPRALLGLSAEDLRAIKEACEGRRVLCVAGALRGKKAAAGSK